MRNIPRTDNFREVEQWRMWLRNRIENETTITDGSSNISLPAGTFGAHLYIKCTVATITVTAASGETIDGETTQVLYIDDCMEIIFDGISDWVIV